jgi:hypothetical protein
VTALVCGDVEKDAHSDHRRPVLHRIDRREVHRRRHRRFAVADGRITDIHAQWNTLKLVQEPGVISATDSAID